MTLATLEWREWTFRFEDFPDGPVTVRVSTSKPVKADKYLFPAKKEYSVHGAKVVIGRLLASDKEYIENLLASYRREALSKEDSE